MSISNKHFRIHPAIGFARVGNSPEYYLAPETAAAMPLEGRKYTGGIPLNAKTGEPIRSSEIRDREGRLVRTAARFKIYAHATDGPACYPSPEAREVCVGDEVDGRTVVDIVWQVHLANKKANQYLLENPDIGDRDLLIHGYRDGNLPPLRNLHEGIDPNGLSRLRRLVIDPGPRALKASDDALREFNRDDPASYYDDKAGKIQSIPEYPKSFPSDSFGPMYDPWGEIDTLGEALTDDRGRLIVVGGYGRASAVLRDGHGSDPQPFPLEGAVDNDGWFDDCSDGPVGATLVFDDGSTVSVHGAWLNVTDPAFAPQTQNVVSLWDDIFDTWVRKLDLEPELYRDGCFNVEFKPSFQDHILPFFKAASVQRWNTNLPEFAIQAHDAVGCISADDEPSQTIMAGLAFVRNPNISQQSYQGAPFMPLSLGDNGKSFLSPSLTQYFLLSQWERGRFAKQKLALSEAERLDRDVLINCLGGRFSPGIDMTFIVRQPDFYITDWRNSGSGPFRVRAARLDYSRVDPKRPFLAAGWVPLQAGDGAVEPGDGSKFMSVPWHTDYNSCGTHETAPNPPDNTQPAQTTLYWSWPAQRPVAVYTAEDASEGKLDTQRYSVRGQGTGSSDPSSQGRFQSYLDFVHHWPEVGTVLQATQIDDVEGRFADDWYLEVQSQFSNADSTVEPWPINGLVRDKA
ncbi:MAG: LodA/GoxA family CTQ-dependent oxidase [Xanthomonadaceae bacterium]|nr:LodA/GoxA family CTQ-dependent oxidase [Xanthomonadaceae bacterium]